MTTGKAPTDIRTKSVQYSRPSCLSDMETAVQECSMLVNAGKDCYCTTFCRCRECQKIINPRCKLEDLVIQGGCVFGCYLCPNCKPCW